MSPPRNPKPPLSVTDLKNWDLISEFRAEMAKHLPEEPPKPPGGPTRLLHREDYLSSFLFAIYNPQLDSMRGLCAASHLSQVQQQVCKNSISLGSFSEAQTLVDASQLEEIFLQLARDNLIAEQQKNPASPDTKRLIKLVDSTVLRALPRMDWAEWRHQNTTQRCVRLHLKFNLLNALPDQALITEGKRCERKALAEMIEENDFYVGDRYYGRDYGFLHQLTEKNCSYIMRLYAEAVFHVVKENPLTEEDRAAGVVSDQLVKLGTNPSKDAPLVRIICVDKPTLDEPLWLVTNQLDETKMSAAETAEIYHQRWEIELFFRWLKCIFQEPKKWHWFAESENGVGIQIYLSLIAALLLARRLGRLPNKRIMEALHFYLAGMIDAEELEAAIEREETKRKETKRKKAESKQKA
jgi:hypothetical protein